MNELLQLPRHAQHLQRFLYTQPQLGTVIVNVNPVVDTCAFTLTINGKATTFEFDSNSSVVAGRIPITIGGSVANALNNAQVAISNAYPGQLRFFVDSGYLYIINLYPDMAMAVALVTGPIAVDNPVQPRPAFPMAVQFITRQVLANDISRGQVNVPTGISNIYYVQVIFRVSFSNFQIVPWNGTINISGDVVQMPQGTTTNVFALGNVLQMIVYGDIVE